MKSVLLLWVLAGVAGAQAPTRHIPIRKETPKMPPETVTVVKMPPPVVIVTPAPPPDTVRRVDTLDRRRWLLIPLPLIFWSAAHDDHDRIAGPVSTVNNVFNVYNASSSTSTATSYYYTSWMTSYYYNTSNVANVFGCACVVPVIDSDGCRSEEEHERKHHAPHWDHPPTTPTPEPATWALMASGLVLVGGLARRRRYSANSRQQRARLSFEDQLKLAASVGFPTPDIKLVDAMPHPTRAEWVGAWEKAYAAQR